MLRAGTTPRTLAPSYTMVPRPITVPGASTALQPIETPSPSDGPELAQPGGHAAHGHAARHDPQVGELHAGPEVDVVRR